MKKINKTKIEKILKKGFRYYTIATIVLSILPIISPIVYAEDDPITVVNNLSDFIFQLTKGIGTIVAGYGVTQIGLSFTSHDASQRVNGVMFFVGGAIIFCAKKILTTIAG